VYVKHCTLGFPEIKAMKLETQYQILKDSGTLRAHGCIWFMKHRLANKEIMLGFCMSIFGNMNMRQDSFKNIYNIMYIT
jgi:hypothetical protein